MWDTSSHAFKGRDVVFKFDIEFLVFFRKDWKVLMRKLDLTRFEKTPFVPRLIENLGYIQVSHGGCAFCFKSLWYVLKLNCSSRIICFGSSSSFSLASRTLSKTFEKVEWRLIGRWFSGCEWSFPGFGTVIIVAVFLFFRKVIQAKTGVVYN